MCLNQVLLNEPLLCLGPDVVFVIVGEKGLCDNAYTPARIEGATTQAKMVENSIDVAYTLACGICRDAIWYEGRCSWFGASVETVFNRPQLVNKTLGPELYDGVAGIALFLGQLYRVRQDRIILDTMVGAINQVLATSGWIERRFELGFFAGLSGIAYVLVRLGSTFDKKQWTMEGTRLLDAMSENIGDIARRDVVMGAAGAIPVLLAAGQHLSIPQLVGKAEALGRALVHSAERSSSGWSWKTLGVSERGPNLTGFSHGAAGIAWSLLELFNTTHQSVFLSAATEGFNYEKQWYDHNRRNWLDLRAGTVMSSGDKAKGECASVWCHGSAGIGLSRLRAFEITRNDSYKEEVEAALTATMPTLQHYLPKRDSFSVCHGACGNSEFVLEAASLSKETYNSKKIVYDALRRGIEFSSETGEPLKSGAPDGAPTPGFMLGVAGMGYLFLRVHDSINVPSVILPRPDRILGQ